MSGRGGETTHFSGKVRNHLEAKDMTKVKIELDEEVASYLLKQFGVDSKKDLDKGLQQKIEEAVNELLKSWINAQHTKKEHQNLKQ